MAKSKAERGHPIFFFAAILLIAFALLSVGKALSTQSRCDHTAFNGKKHWIVIPPKWECGTGHIKLTTNS